MRLVTDYSPNFRRMALAAGEWRKQEDLVAIGQGAIQIAVDGTAFAVQHQGMTQVRAAGDRIAQVDAAALCGIEQRGKCRSDRERDVLVSIMPSGLGAALQQDVHPDRLSSGVPPEHTAERCAHTHVST